MIVKPKIKIIGKNKNGMFLIEYHGGTQCSQSKENILSLYSPVKEKEQVEVERSSCKGNGSDVSQCGIPVHLRIPWFIGSGRCQTRRTVKKIELMQLNDKN